MVIPRWVRVAMTFLAPAALLASVCGCIKYTGPKVPYSIHTAYPGYGKPYRGDTEDEIWDQFQYETQHVEVAPADPLRGELIHPTTFWATIGAENPRKLTVKGAMAVVRDTEGGSVWKLSPETRQELLDQVPTSWR